ncbi:MAG TPA: glycoside hydrolase family 16 protein [Opitutaceae bacterium]|nr:glycoside hydrolase family 16 protein [Opitutaceae bacterium]
MKTALPLLLGLVLAGGAGRAGAPPPPVWSDEFNQADGAAPDPTKWSYDVGGDGWGNGELEVYTDSRDNSRIVSDPDATDGKALAIRAVRSPGGGYTSARLKTEGKFTLRYGRVEVRMKLPRGKGIWPACWMLGDNLGTAGWPACGEIDIMENLGHRPGVIYGTLHGPGYSGAHGLQRSFALPAGGAFSDGYHVFAVEKTPQEIRWSVDGQVYHACTPAALPARARWVFNDQPFFLLLNLAVGGYWPGNPDATTVFPQTLSVDYVRVFAASPGS